MPNKKYLILTSLLYLAISASAQVTFVIESVPNSTPKSDTIFLTGSFNNWRVSDPKYMLHRQLNGQLSVTIPVNKTFEYKFTRGSWLKVETDSRNSYTSNRVYKAGDNNTVYIDIVNWLDLGGVEKMHLAVFYFFAVAFLALVLIFWGLKISGGLTVTYKAFLLINSMLILLFLGFVAYNFVSLIQQSYFVFLLKVLLFAWGPCVYIFAIAFKDGKWPGNLYVHFIPAVVIASFEIVLLLNSKAFSGFLSYGFPPFTIQNIIISGGGLAITFLYMVKMARGVFDHLFSHLSSDRGVKFLEIFSGLQVLIFFTFAVNLLLPFFKVSNPILEDFEIVLVVFSAVIFLETFFIWRFPEVLKEKTQHIVQKDIFNEQEKISTYMRCQKPYRNPELTIELLARDLDVKPHVLSKVLNESFNKNFRDFVNWYRIKEFIHLAENGKLQQYTFLALAHEAGFNSKSTFNLAFKKVMKQSPREYFKGRRQDVGSKTELKELNQK